MKIAVLADMIQATPPKKYGGTQRVTYNIIEELIKRGHEVTLFGTGDSYLSGRLIVCAPCALHLNERNDYERSIMIQLGIFLEYKDEFDIVHSHLDYFAFPLARLLKIPLVTTIHRRIDTPDMQEVFGHFNDIPLVAISKFQQKQYPNANWLNVIHNGLLFDHLKFSDTKGDYLAFLGRIYPEKGPVQAIEIARRTGIPLKIAARIDKGDKDYFDNVVKPLLDSRLVEFIGEIADHEKSDFLGRAKALIFPVQWPEPFGLVLIEAMACGTPVIATDRGAVSEIVVDGETGFIGETIEDLISSLDKINKIDPKKCRLHVENNFSVDKMVNSYESLFASLVNSS